MTMTDIVKETSAAHKVSLKEMMGSSRLPEVSRARQEAMYKIRLVTTPRGTVRYTLPQIGRFFGRDHTTIIHGIRAYLKRNPH